jgi:LacI family transcriptional regulator
LKSWGGNGIIARVPSHEDAQAILNTRLPTILVGVADQWLAPENPLAKYSDLRSDSHAVGRMAAEHFLDKAFPYYAVVSEVIDHNWSRWRREAYVSQLAEAGFAVHIYHPNEESGNWGIEQKRMRPWLRSLPKPIGLFTTSDARGRQVLDACQAEEINVPEEIAVLGVDNDELMCEVSNPPLSSIAMETVQGGYKAAECLNMVMKGKSRKRKTIFYGPLGVIARHSTEVFHVNHPLVSRSLQFISENATLCISVGHVVAQSGVSRRTLEMKFREVLGRSILEEINRVKLDKVRTALISTSLPIAEIAENFGFDNVAYMKKMLQREFGMTVQGFRGLKCWKGFS